MKSKTRAELSDLGQVLFDAGVKKGREDGYLTAVTEDPELLAQHKEQILDEVIKEVEGMDEVWLSPLWINRDSVIQIINKMKGK